MKLLGKCFFNPHSTTDRGNLVAIECISAHIIVKVKGLNKVLGRYVVLETTIRDMVYY